VRFASVAVRAGALCCLVVAAVVLAVGGSEYPGSTRAGLDFAARLVLPLALLPWLNLWALHAAAHGTRGAAGWIGVALAADLLLVATTAPHAGAGAAPVARALPWIGALLALGCAGLLAARVRLALPRRS
jgi:hypothetical protein